MYPIETQQDFDTFFKYFPSAQFIACNLMRRVREALGDKGLVNVATHRAFNTLNQQALRKLPSLRSAEVCGLTGGPRAAQIIRSF